jgi:hypothetical protein
MLDSIEKRAGSDRRAAIAEPAPTGEGAVVMDFVEERINNLIELYSVNHYGQHRPIMKTDHLRVLLADLQERKEAGTKKYGTPLRINNGRSALVDLYQEMTGAIMYCGQARMEGDTDAGAFLELLINIGHQLAGKLPR